MGTHNLATLQVMNLIKPLYTRTKAPRGCRLRHPGTPGCRCSVLCDLQLSMSSCVAVATLLVDVLPGA